MNSQEKRDPFVFDASLFRSDESRAELARVQAERETKSYALYERVHVGVPESERFGVITKVTPTETGDLFSVEMEQTGSIELVWKRDIDKAEQLPPAQKIEVTGPKHKVGEIVEYHGHRYEVFETSDYVSAQDVADAEDVDHFDASTGYHAKARLID